MLGLMLGAAGCDYYAVTPQLRPNDEVSPSQKGHAAYPVLSSSQYPTNVGKQAKKSDDVKTHKKTIKVGGGGSKETDPSGDTVTDNNSGTSIGPPEDRPYDEDDDFSVTDEAAFDTDTNADITAQGLDDLDELLDDEAQLEDGVTDDEEDPMEENPDDGAMDTDDDDSEDLPDEKDDGYGADDEDDFDDDGTAAS